MGRRHGNLFEHQLRGKRDRAVGIVDVTFRPRPIERSARDRLRRCSIGCCSQQVPGGRFEGLPRRLVVQVRRERPACPRGRAETLPA